MATQKGSGKEKKILDGDNPPILVGGGGSSLIWIQKTLNPQLVDPNVQTNGPKNPGDYYCFNVNQDVTSVTVKNGNGGSQGHNVNNKKFSVDFS